MAIKATGVITENPGDGNHLKVRWTQAKPGRKWYLYTNRKTIWRVMPGNWAADALIEFTFDGKEQDFPRFCNAPYWRERFGSPAGRRRFAWADFYMAVADKLVLYQGRRQELLAKIRKAMKGLDGLPFPEEHRADGTAGPLEDICPFTVMGLFNRGQKPEIRKAIAAELAKLLKVTVPVPNSFDGIPVLNNQRSWRFCYAKDRQPDDIEILWDIFDSAIASAKSEKEAARITFISAFDKAMRQFNVGWNLTMGLSWIRPWEYPALDNRSRIYIRQKLDLSIGHNGPEKRCSASDYLALQETLENRFAEELFPVHSYPELSYSAWLYRNGRESGWRASLLQKVGQFCQENQSPEFTLKSFQKKFLPDLQAEFPENNSVTASIRRGMQTLRDEDLIEFLGNGRYLWLGSDDESFPEITGEQGTEEEQPPIRPYSWESITAEGCFLEQSKLEMIRSRLEVRKNLILQGPPGTGKTWLARRLAYALLGERSDDRVRAVQFHPNLAYEDFVCGWRPSAGGKLELADGPFREMIDAAREDRENRKYVIVIEEINRGNPARIFGEMLTLLESDKRTPDEALELTYRRYDGERVYIPSNLYVIGTMNIADHSLALVDYALRRRFAFINLEPEFGERWRNWVHEKCSVALDILKRVENRLNELNDRIAGDPCLGRQFRIGHSFVTPAADSAIGDFCQWFRQVVETEIGPLLDQYWFDSPATSREAVEKLLEGF
ncbi:MAG: AAA domain-containing protein [Lentisphaeria bacterium]|nr:AAA domain-containing protein [Lentisphaeria bacterium]